MSKVTIISACEHREDKDFEPMSRRLVYSIRTNGGKYKDSDIIMWHSEDAAPSTETKAWLVDAGCIVVAGQPLNARSIKGDCEPIGNKIMAANTPVSTEYSLWIDTDMYVLDTALFEALLDRTVDVAAVGTEYAFHRWARMDLPDEDRSWAKFYALAGIDPPSADPKLIAEPLLLVTLTSDNDVRNAAILPTAALIAPNKVALI